MPVRIAEAQAVRRIIEERFGKDHAGDKRWVICGDMNDYRQRVMIERRRYRRLPLRGRSTRAQSCLNVLLADGFCENVVERRPELDRWTLYHTRGPARAASVPARLHPAVAGARGEERDGASRTSSATASPGARSFRPARRSIAFRAPAGTGPRRPTIARWRHPGHGWPEHELRPSAQCHPAGRRRRRAARSRRRIRSSATTREAIAENWQREIAANPALFDGTVVLLSALSYRDSRLVGRCHAVRYSTFMHWRGNRHGARRRTCLRPCDAGVRRQCAGGDPHGRAYGQCRPRLFRRRLVRADRFSRRSRRCRFQHDRAR